MIDAGDLAYLGTVNGVPVYADRDDVSSISSQLSSARANGTELNTIITNQDIANGLTNVKVLYVPTQATGCNFQAMQRVEEVRKQR